MRLNAGGTICLVLRVGEGGTAGLWPGMVRFPPAPLSFCRSVLLLLWSRSLFPISALWLAAPVACLIEVALSTALL